MRQQQQHMTSADWLSLIVLSMFWGGSYFFFKILVAEVPVFTIVAVRVVGAALILVAIVYLRGGSLPSSPAIWGAFAVVGIFNNIVPFCLIIWSESQISSGLAAILNATTPVFSVLLSHFLVEHQRLNAHRIAGVLIGLAGVCVLMGPSALLGLNLKSIAQLACIVAALSYAWVAIYARRFKALGVSPLVTATGQVIMSGAIITPVALLASRFQPFHQAPSAAVLASFAGLILLSTVFAYILYFKVLSSAGATNALLVTFLTPVSALLLGALVLGERLVTSDIVGTVLIFIGLAAIDGRALNLLRRPSVLTQRPR
ncbi:MAG: DMT family transporter [Candidatus Eremiobacteraeota bacterium]|nr:DMT family transporter [Candidatus Eremiobacteraeota bacterium]